MQLGRQKQKGGHVFAGNGQDKLQIQLLEGQLAWFVHIISAILKGRVSATTTAENQVAQHTSTLCLVE